MRRKYIILLVCLVILILLVALRKESQSSLRFMQKQDQLVKHHAK